MVGRAFIQVALLVLLTIELFHISQGGPEVIEENELKTSTEIKQAFESDNSKLRISRGTDKKIPNNKETQKQWKIKSKDEKEIPRKIKRLSRESKRKSRKNKRKPNKLQNKTVKIKKRKSKENKFRQSKKRKTKRARKSRKKRKNIKIIRSKIRKNEKKGKTKPTKVMSKAVNIKNRKSKEKKFIQSKKKQMKRANKSKKKRKNIKTNRRSKIRKNKEKSKKVSLRKDELARQGLSEYILKVKDFKTLSNYLRQIKRLESSCKIMDSKAKKSSDAFDGTVAALDSVIGSASESVDQITIKKDELKNCKVSAKELCKKSSVDSCQNETLIATCKKELQDWIDEFNVNCLKESEKCFDIPNIAHRVECTEMAGNSGKAVESKKKCISKAEKGSFGYCKNLQVEASEILVPAHRPCPTSESCPICSAPDKCPTCLAPVTCPTCSAPDACPTCPAPVTCPLPATCICPDPAPVTCPTPVSCPVCSTAVKSTMASTAEDATAIGPTTTTKTAIISTTAAIDVTSANVTTSAGPLEECHDKDFLDFKHKAALHFDEILVNLTGSKSRSQRCSPSSCQPKCKFSQFSSCSLPLWDALKTCALDGTNGMKECMDRQVNAVPREDCIPCVCKAIYIQYSKLTPGCTNSDGCPSVTGDSCDKNNYALVLWYGPNPSRALKLPGFSQTSSNCDISVPWYTSNSALFQMYQGKLYGCNGDGCHSYNLGTMSWCTENGIKWDVKRWYAAGTLIGNEWIVQGGVDYPTKVDIGTAVVWTPGSTANWVEAPSAYQPPSPIAYHCIVNVNGQLMQIGGIKNGGDWRRECYLDGVQVASLQWGRGYHACHVFKGKVWVAGGTGTGGANDGKVEIYDIQANSWSLGPLLPFRIWDSYPRLLVFDDTLYYIGGNGKIYGISSDQSSWIEVAEDKDGTGRKFFAVSVRMKENC